MPSLIRGAAIVAWQTLRAHKLRTALTCLSLALAVLALVGIDASSQVAASAVLAESKLTQGLPETWSAPVEAGADADRKASRAQELLESILRPNGGSSVLVAIGAAKLDGLDVTVVAIQGDLRALRPFRLIAGHWLSAGDAERSPEIVLGKAAMGQIYLGSQTLSLRAAPISIGGRVVGSVDDALREPTVYVRLADLHLWTDASPGEWSLQILGHSGLGRMGETKAAMMTALGVVGLPASIPVRLDQLGATADAVATVRVAFLAVATISLLVGALGILNIGLVSLHERVEELALRRACGAIAAQIGLAILLEGVFAAVVAACFAIVGAGLLLPIVTQLLFPNYPTSEATGFPFQTAVLGMAAAALAGFFGGIVPAIRAARMQIANVMRA